MNVTKKILSFLFPVFLAVLILTFSIGLPIYVRPFYYMQIEPLGITEMTGLEYDEIREAYDEVLDYLTVPGNEFGTGVFAYTSEGKSHFEDCKVLFDLNAWGFIISLAAVVLTVALSKLKVIELYRPCGLGLYAWCGIGTLGLFGAIALLAATDFDAAFRVFHMIFFPGKDNWVFDPRYDQIIWALPQEFFMNCAILIVSSIILICAALIVIGFVRKKENKS